MFSFLNPLALWLGALLAIPLVIHFLGRQRLRKEPFPSLMLLEEKFAKERRPVLLWSRAQEYFLLGQRNRGIAEMFQVLRTFPQHPALGEWISALESQLNPPPAAPTPPAAGPGTIPGAQ